MVDGTLDTVKNRFRVTEWNNERNVTPSYSEYMLNLTCRFLTKLKVSWQPITFCQEI